MAQATVGNYGMRVPRLALLARLGSRGYSAVLKTLTVSENVHPGKPRGIGRLVRRAYYFANVPVDGTPTEHIFLPRVKCAPLLKAKVISGVDIDANALPEPRHLTDAQCEFAPPDELYSYQEAAVKHVCETAFSEERVAAFSSSAYLQMDPGLGKTRTAAAIICRMRVPTVVSVPTIGIGEQWMDEFAESCPGLRCAFYKNLPKKTKKVAPSAATHDVIIIVINTLREKTPEFLAGFGLVVFDEAHELHSPENSKALWLAQTKYVLGLSATPLEAKHGLDALVPLHLGPIIWQKNIPGFDAGEAKFIGECWRIEYAGHPDYCETATTPSGTVSAIMTIGNINKDPYRLKLIAEQVARLHGLHETADAAKYGLGEGRRHGVYVFAEHREQLPAIREALLEQFSATDIMVPELEGKGDAKTGSPKPEATAGSQKPEAKSKREANRKSTAKDKIDAKKPAGHPTWPGGATWGDLVTPAGARWWFTADGVAADAESLYLFGENDAEKKSGAPVTKTQAVIRGLPNAIGIRTCYARGSGYRDNTLAQNTEKMRADFAEALERYRAGASLKWVVFPGDGLGTGAAKLNKEAPKTFAALQKLQAEFVTKLREVAAARQTPARSISVLRGGIAKDELGKTRKARAHVVLTTYGFSRRGISLPDMTALVMASPRRNGQTQLLGRIERRGSDQRIKRIVVDIVDVRTGLKSQSTDRVKAYKQKGYAILTSKVSHESINVVMTEAEPEAEPEEEERASLDDLLA